MYGFSPLWVNMWPFRWGACLNSLLHSAHWYFFSPLWIVMWPFRCPALLNEIWHWSHLCCFSPLWIKRCRFRHPACLKALLHWAQFYDFSPLCIKKCIFTLSGRLNVLLHSWHLCGFSTLGLVRWCGFKSIEEQDDILHLAQIPDSSLLWIKLHWLSTWNNWLNQKLIGTVTFTFMLWIQQNTAKTCLVRY